MSESPYPGAGSGAAGERPSGCGRRETDGALGLVLTGGGARAAYQVGLLRAIARRHPDLRVRVMTGVSAGAINATCLAGRGSSFAEAVDKLTELWRSISTDRIYNVDGGSLLANALRWGAGLLSGGARNAPRARGLVDTTPLREFLLAQVEEEGRLDRVAESISSGRLGAFAITATNYATGQAVTWFQGSEVEPWVGPNRRSERCQLTLDHVMASAALPLIFPAVNVDGMWYGDGGVRMAAPLSPALHLGADRILAISTRYYPKNLQPPRVRPLAYPPPAQIAGVLMNAIFLDALDQNAMTLERVNQLIDAVPPERRNGMRRVAILVLRPSEDLGRLAARFEPHLPGPLRFLTRGLGTRGLGSQDWLSMMIFEPQFLEAMIEIGERDGEQRADEIAAFLSNGARPAQTAHAGQ